MLLFAQFELDLLKTQLLREQNQHLPEQLIHCKVMSSPQQNEILKLKSTSEKELSRLQRIFNAHIERINSLKQQLKEAKSLSEKIRIRVYKEVVPLEIKFNNKLVEFVRLFDKHYENAFFKPKERKILAGFILERAYDLVIKAGKIELRPLYEKYADLLSFKAEARPAKYKENDESDFSEKNRPAPDVEKTSEQISKEEKIKADIKDLNKASRAIYTDLVKVFHPDKEQDELKKIRKNQIMHQITEAYQNNDLFELFRLKMELLVSEDTNLSVEESQIKHYNKILNEQIKELETELDLLTGPESMFHRFQGNNPKTMEIRFATEIKKLKTNIKELDNNIKVLAYPENMHLFFSNFR